jgi:ParB-like nuclease domain
MLSTKSELADASPTRPWPAERIEYWALERLIPYASNARLHSEADIDKLAAAIGKWGWTSPVVVDEEGNLLAGHGRARAAAKLGLTSIPVIVANGWSEEDKRAYRLADNQLAARASWDFDLLGHELQELGFADFDVSLVGFEPDQLKTILAGLGSSGLTDPDSVPESPEQPVTRPGDIWLLGDHRVGCGDSTNSADVAQVLAGTEPHLMITDPPYGVDYDPSWRSRRASLAGGGSRWEGCSTTIALTGERPMRCSPEMSLMSGTGRCTATLSPPIWPAAGCSFAPRSSGPSSTLPWAAAITIGSTKPVGTRCVRARPATGKVTAGRRRSGRFRTTIRLATRNTSRVGGTARRNRWSACVVRSPTTADRARRSMTRFSARGRA